MTATSILVVEDEGLIALHLAELLEKAGFLVIGPVNSGDLALRALGGSPAPDLILMDIKLSGPMDGIETARQIRQRNPVPLIFLTAYLPDRTRERVQGLAADGYLTKPVEEKDLLAAINNALAGQARKKP